MDSYVGRSDIYRRIQQMIDGAKNTIKIMTTENGIIRMYKVRERSYAQAIKRGVTVKIALPITKENLWHVKRFVQMGAEIRHLPDVARNRFVNVDGAQVMAHLTSQDDKELDAQDDYGAWTNSVEFAGLTTRFFETLWSKLETYEQRRRQLLFGFIGVVIAILLYFAFVTVTIWGILYLNMTQRVEALICAIAATAYFVIGEKVLRLVSGKKG